MIIKQYYKSNFKNKRTYVDLQCDYCKKMSHASVSVQYADKIFSKYNAHLCQKCAKHYLSKVKLQKFRIEFISSLGTDFPDILSSHEFSCLRTLFTSNEVTDSTLFDFLIKNKFTSEKAKLIYNQYENINSLNDFKNFIFSLKNIFSHRNTSIDHYLVRGHSQETAEIMCYNFSCKGSASTKEKCKKDPLYRQWFNSTRINGGIAAMQSYKSHSSKSKPELNLIEFCEKTFGKENVSTKLITRIEKESVLYQKYNKNYFCHDICIHDKYIIEYNGSYYHKDMLYKKVADMYTYEYEIEKAFYVTQFSNNNDKKYILIWEHDFRHKTNKSLYNYILTIINNDATNNKFFSKREEDIIAYNMKYKQYKSDIKMASLYKDWIISLQKISHCSRVKVSAIATTDDHKVIANGVNGTNPGFENCDDHFKGYDTTTEEFKHLHGEWSSINEIHAEMSLLVNCVRDGKSLANAILYVSHEPCTNCAKTLSTVGLQKIYYLNSYDRASPDSRKILNLSGVQVYSLNDFLEKQKYIDSYIDQEVIP